MKPTLLAPAGNIEILNTALKSGADAVYIGANKFSARTGTHFSDREIEEAAYTCHLYNSKLYLAINTIISDREFDEALKTVEKAYKSGVDALIIQDNGFAMVCKERFPDIDLHASTQMSIHSSYGVTVAEKMGFSQAVLARELTLDEISEITKTSNIALEMFVHGALCYCYSGKCLMSSLIGGRSGNRGKCAQPCRMRYTSDNSSGYMLSPKDLCTINHLPEVLNSGVSCLKIEGRLKNSDYVSIVTSTYRKYIDMAYSNEKYIVDQNDINQMKQVFNRSGFTSGYLKNSKVGRLITKDSPKHTGLFLGKVEEINRKAKKIEVSSKLEINNADILEVRNNTDEPISFHISKAEKIEKDIYQLWNVPTNILLGSDVYKMSSSALSKSIKERLQRNTLKNTPIDISLNILENVPMYARVKFMNKTFNVSSETIPTVSENIGTSIDRIKEQLNKTGDSPIYFRNINIEMGNNLTIPISSINQLRRDVISLTEEKIKSVPSERKICELDGNYPVKEIFKKDKDISLFFFTKRDIDFSKLDYNRIYYPFTEYNIDMNIPNVYLWLPCIIRGETKIYIEENINKFNYNGIMVSSLDGLELCHKYGIENVLLNSDMNIFNSYSIYDLKTLYPEISTATLSVEMMKAQIEDLNCPIDIDLECIMYGRLPVMCTARCIDMDNCKECRENIVSYITDRKNYRFPIIHNPIDCSNTILNSNVLFPETTVDNIDGVRLNIFDEDEETINKLITHYRRKESDFSLKDYTKGHFFRGV